MQWPAGVHPKEVIADLWPVQVNKCRVCTAQPYQVVEWGQAGAGEPEVIGFYGGEAVARLAADRRQTALRRTARDRAQAARAQGAIR